MDRQLIESYVAGGATLRAAVAGLTAADLAAKPGPGAWSIQELVLHLLDADLIAVVRMKRILAEDGPRLTSFDENRFVERLHYGDQPVAEAIELFDLNRRLFAHVLRKLPDEAFDRVGQHDKRGPLTVTDILRGYIHHVDHHLAFLYGKREKLGKALK